MANPNAGILEEIEDQHLTETNIGAGDDPNTITLVSITGGCPTVNAVCFITTDAVCPATPTG
ncbi:plantaricin C family lantibiotic [Streptomonospora sp. PA3]|uniref:plantaricin C family lantibiotic n=1 Tax=Streptomonospora sp. PA3 TaxID=2607326 RepID=UPI0012DF1277|nr:plantaricin C family lantibiotic [Streptomonospora sp. PA3]MUL40656.1 plantaricin C family lantibiotic [Streptomonospora sp. PA3]